MRFTFPEELLVVGQLDHKRNIKSICKKREKRISSRKDLYCCCERKKQK